LDPNICPPELVQDEEEMHPAGHPPPMQLSPDDEAKEYDEPLKEEPVELIISRPTKLSLVEGREGLKFEKTTPEFCEKITKETKIASTGPPLLIFTFTEIKPEAGLNERVDIETEKEFDDVLIPEN
jgi:hypothetical protein